MYKYIKNILIISFFITGCIYACDRGDNCFIPEANAGNDKTYYIGSSVTLDGSGSFDPEGSTLTYSWTSEYFSLDGANLLVECENANNVLEFIENACLDIYGYGDANLQSDCEENGFVSAIYNSCLSSQYSAWFPCNSFCIRRK